MYCSSCGKKNIKEASYCFNCGRKLENNSGEINCLVCNEVFDKKENSCPCCGEISTHRLKRGSVVKQIIEESKVQKNRSTYRKRKGSKFFKFLILILIISFVASYDPLDGYKSDKEENVSSDKPVANLPMLAGEKELVFLWNYKNEKYRLEKKYYYSLDEYYSKLSKDYCYYGDLPANWEEESYKLFLKIDKEDSSFKNLADDLKGLAEVNGYTDNELVEFVLSFVQNIPYDDHVADLILNSDDDIDPRRPYEVLYDNNGICTSKSFLAYVLFQELGYGVALLSYDDDQHMALGLRCPYNYSLNGSGYCYAETTSFGHPIGLIPEMGKDSSEIEKIGTVNLYSKDRKVEKKHRLGAVKILLKSTGISYTGAEDNIKRYDSIMKLQLEVEKMDRELSNALVEIEKGKNYLNEIKVDLDYFDSLEMINQYNNLVPLYNFELSKTDNLITSYNIYVNEYDLKVTKMNSIIRELYPDEN